jgi:hypothetical protein
MSAFGATGDDYVVFCEGLRQICGVDLSQYKRPQRASSACRTRSTACAAIAPSSTRCSTA